MKQTNQSRSGIASQWLSGITAFTFLLNTVSPVYAQTSTTTNNTAGSVINDVSQIAAALGSTPAVFNQTPQQLQMATAIADMQSKMNQCLLTSVAGSKTADQAKTTLEGLFKKALTDKQAAKKGIDPAASNQLDCYKKAACDSECGAPEKVDLEPDCTLRKEAEKDRDTIKAYIDYLGKTSKCSNAKNDAIMKQKAAFDCQMGVLQAGVAGASKTLQDVLAANNKQVQTMTKYMGALNDQQNQITALVGGQVTTGVPPDLKTTEVAGSWATLKKELDDDLAGMNTRGAEFKNNATDLNLAIKKNADTLVQKESEKLGACLFGNLPTAPTETCWRAKGIYTTDQQGNQKLSGVETAKTGCPKYEQVPCTPAQAARSQIEMSYLINSRGQIENNAQTCSQAKQAADSFDKQMVSLSSELGTGVKNWNDFANKYSSSIPAKGFAVLSHFSAACTKIASNWKKNADNPAVNKIDADAKAYDDQKRANEQNRVKLSAELETGITKMNQRYSKIISVMGEGTVSLSTTECTTSDPSKMSECYDAIKKNVNGLMLGNGGTPTGTAKVITGANGAPSFAVPCSGVDKCISAYSKVREQVQAQLKTVGTATQNFVDQGNSNADAQLRQYAQFLSTAQDSVLKQYNTLKASFLAMGIAAPEMPNMAEAAGLEPKNGGPFQFPGDKLPNVLSGYVNGGLINFKDTGLKDAMSQSLDELKSKKSGASENLATWNANAKSFNKALNQCRKDELGQITADCNRCKSEEASRTNAIISGGNADLIKGLTKAFFPGGDTSSLVGGDGDCKLILPSCGNYATKNPGKTTSEPVDVSASQEARQ